MLTASVDGSAAIWDAESGKRLAGLIGHYSVVWNALMSNDGSRVATASLDGGARLWDARADDLWGSLDNRGQARFLRFVTGGRVVTGSADGRVLTWDGTTGRLLRTSTVSAIGYRDNFGGQVTSVSRDGTRLFRVEGTRLEIWDLERSALLATYAMPDGGELECVDSSDDTVFVGTAGGRVRAIRAADGTLARELRGRDTAVYPLVASRDGTRVVTVHEDERATRIWDAASGAQLAAIEQEGRTESVEISPDNTRVATGSNNGIVRIWDAKSGALLATLDGHTSEISHLRFSPDGRLLASGGLDKSAKVWDAQAGALLASFDLHEHTVLVLDFNADGTRLVTGSLDGTAKIWDTSLDERTAAEVTAAVRCRVPFRLEGTRVVRARTDCAGP